MYLIWYTLTQLNIRNWIDIFCICCSIYVSFETVISEVIQRSTSLLNACNACLHSIQKICHSPQEQVHSCRSTLHEYFISVHRKSWCSMQRWITFSLFLYFLAIPFLDGAKMGLHILTSNLLIVHQFHNLESYMINHLRNEKMPSLRNPTIEILCHIKCHDTPTWI